MFRQEDRTIRNQKGFSLIWVVAAITIVAALTAGVLSISTTSKKNELMLTFDTQARLLAESGINYASTYAAQILNGTNANQLDALDGQIITANLGANQQIKLAVHRIGTSYDYTVTSTGTVNLGKPFEANAEITNVINAPWSGTGIYIVQSKPGTAVGTPTSVTVNASSLNDYTAGISFDPLFAGTAFNSVASANFSHGIGSLLNGIRVYFTFSISSGSAADGFVFAIKNGTWNTPRDAGGPPAGTSHGSFLGYAGPGYPYWGNGLGLRPPKMGVEFDIYTNSGHSGVDDDGRNDPDNHHIANVFWGTTWNISSTATTPPTNDFATSSSYAFDDNVHGITGSNILTDSLYYGTPNYTNPSVSPGLRTISNRNEIVGTVNADSSVRPVPVRIEVVRPTTAISGNANASLNGKYAYVIKTWYNCTAVGCNDITVDYGGAASYTLQNTVYMTLAEHTQFQFFVFGYQVSTGASTGSYNFSIPRIGMR